MEKVLSFCLAFLNFLEGAINFFSTPLSEVTEVVFSDFGFTGNLIGTGIQTVINGLINLLPVLGNLSIGEIFFGSGITFILLWRLWKFIGDGFGL